jgi:hypothetical protein
MDPIPSFFSVRTTLVNAVKALAPRTLFEHCGTLRAITAGPGGAIMNHFTHYVTGMGRLGRRGRFGACMGVQVVATIVVALVVLRPANAAVSINIPAGDVNALIAALDEAHAPGNTRTDYILILEGGTYTLESVNNNYLDRGPNGLPAIRGDSRSITIAVAVNATAIIERRSTADLFRIFYVDSFAGLYLNFFGLQRNATLIIRGGALGSEADGGGIRSHGTLAIGCRQGFESKTHESLHAWDLRSLAGWQ